MDLTLPDSDAVSIEYQADKPQWFAILHQSQAGRSRLPQPAGIERGMFQSEDSGEPTQSIHGSGYAYRTAPVPEIYFCPL